jgi:hypothetical protein
LDEAGVVTKRYGFSVALPRLSEREVAGIRGHGALEIGVGTVGIDAATPLSGRKQPLGMALGVEYEAGR